MNAQEKFTELISLTQLYLSREYKGKDICFASRETYSYFQRLSHETAKPFVNLPVPEKITPRSNNETVYNNVVPVPVPVLVPVPTSVPERAVPRNNIETPRSNSGTGTFTNQVPNHKRKQLALEPLVTTTPYQIDHSIKELINTKFPDLLIHEAIPDDAMARKLKNGWQKENTIPQVMILTFNQDESQISFLKNIAKAITLCLAPARVISGLKIEAEKKWDKLVEAQGVKLIIACDYAFFLQPSLKPHFKEDPKQGKHSLGSIPLLLLSDLNLYLQQPQLKPLLWQAICKELR